MAGLAAPVRALALACALIVCVGAVAEESTTAVVAAESAEAHAAELQSELVRTHKSAPFGACDRVRCRLGCAGDCLSLLWPSVCSDSGAC
jgi:hypothetical protein